MLKSYFAIGVILVLIALLTFCTITGLQVSFCWSGENFFVCMIFRSFQVANSFFAQKMFLSCSGEKNSSGPSRGLWRHVPPENFENFMDEII